MSQSIKNRGIVKASVAFFLLVMLTLSMPFCASAASSAKVTLPVEQVFPPGQTDAVAVDYLLTPEAAGNPMPQGTVNGVYTLHLPAGQKTASIEIIFSAPGTYQYRLTERVPDGFAYTWKTQNYLITIQVGQDFTTIVTIQNADGKKVATLSWAYEEAQPTPEPSPTPGVSPTPAPTMGPNSTAKPGGEIGNADDMANVPQTGDESAMRVWVTLGVLASVGLLCCGYLLVRMREVPEDD